MKISLTKSEKETLTKHKLLSNNTHLNDGDYMIVDEETASQIRDNCGDLLQTSGFDADYGPTPLGIILEQLIDKLYS